MVSVGTYVCSQLRLIVTLCLQFGLCDNDKLIYKNNVIRLEFWLTFILLIELFKNNSLKQFINCNYDKKK